MGWQCPWLRDYPQNFTFSLKASLLCQIFVFPTIPQPLTVNYHVTYQLPEGVYLLIIHWIATYSLDGVFHLLKDIRPWWITLNWWAPYLFWGKKTLISLMILQKLGYKLPLLWNSCHACGFTFGSLQSIKIPFWMDDVTLLMYTRLCYTSILLNSINEFPDLRNALFVILANCGCFFPRSCNILPRRSDT